MATAQCPLARSTLIPSHLQEQLMQKNVGSTDKMFRITAAVVLVALILFNTVTGTLAIVAGIVAVLLVGTSLLSFCPAYFPLKISTVKKDAGTK
jgi:hypothetical protein